MSDENKDKDSIIKEIYYDYANMGSMSETLKQARAKDKTITMADVRSWYDRFLVRRINLPGYNSLYQIDPVRNIR
jgi:hypothetical protein